MVKEALEKIQEAEQHALQAVEAAKEAVAGDLLEAGKEAEEIVRKAEAASREQARTLLSESRQQGGGAAREQKQETQAVLENLRQQAQANKAKAIQRIRETFTSQWQ